MNWTFNDTFHRTIIFSNIPISGTFKFSNIFQISKGKDDWPVLQYGLNHNLPIILEYDSKAYRDYIILHSSKSNNDATKLQESFRFLDFKKEILALITLVGNANFFVEKPYLISNDELGSDYFIHTFLDCSSMDNIIIDNKNFTKTQNYMGDSVHFPENNFNFFTQYFNLEKDALKRFRMSLMLYYNSIDIRTHSPSMSYVALISAIENLVDFEGAISGFKANTCKSCSQKEFKISNRFKEFMKKYCRNSSKEFHKLLGKIYSKRSSIAHLGELLYLDYANTELDINGSSELNHLKMLVRVALFNWVILYEKK